MIGIAEARGLVDRRLDRLEHALEADRTAEIGEVAMLCLGSDVRGPELEDELRRATRECLRLMQTTACDCSDGEGAKLNCASPTILAGVLNRTFWLGYEFGKDAAE